MRASRILFASGQTTPGIEKTRRVSRHAIYPLAKDLATGDTRSRGPAAHRVDIVNPALCDDILSYIGPSLMQHKHCDIIDSNPGAGLWSSKLHDLLQPRRHVLLEPDRIYNRFLQPFLDAPNSKYLRMPADTSVLKTLTSLVEQLHEILPEQHALQPDDPRLNQLNTTLLVNINLSRTRGKSSRSVYFLTREVIDYLTSTSWTHTGLHQYGQVRILAWMGEYFKEKIIPRALNDMDPSGVGVKARADTLILADHPGPKLPREPTTLDIASAVRTAGKMKASNINLSPERQNLLHQQALSMINTADVADIQAKLHADVITSQSSIEERKQLEADFESGLLIAPKTSVPKSVRDHNLHWERLEELRRTTDRWQRNRLRTVEMVKSHVLQAERVIELQYIVIDESRPAQDRLAAKEEIDKLQAQLKKVKRSALNRIQTFHNMLDNRKAFYHNPSLLSWDNRPFEPLHTQAKEFYPQQPLALVDITPKPAPRKVLAEDLRYWQRFTNRLYERPTTSIVKALNTLSQGSADALLPKLQAVHDPRQGGSFDLEELRVRSLNLDMVNEIVDAWKSWTFRPDTLEHELTNVRLGWDDLIDGDEGARAYDNLG